MMRMRSSAIWFASALAAVSATAAPLRESNAPISSLKGHNTGAPIDWTADRIEVQSEAHRVFLTGSVTATQAELALHAPRVTVAYDTIGGLNVHYINATGGVKIESPTEVATGALAIYDLDRRLITMIGNVTLKQRDGSVRGERLVINLDNGQATLSGGRVSGTFLPKRKS